MTILQKSRAMIQLIRPELPRAAGISVVVGQVIALITHPIAFVLSLIAWVLGFFYNWKLKAAELWGILIVSTSVGMTFFMGGVSVGQAANPIVWILLSARLSLTLP